MRSNSKLFRSAASWMLLAPTMVSLCAAPCLANDWSRPYFVAQQGDPDMPPELRRRFNLREQFKAGQDVGGGSQYGERPFRRPRSAGDQPGNANAPAGNAQTQPGGNDTANQGPGLRPGAGEGFGPRAEMIRRMRNRAMQNQDNPAGGAPLGGQDHFGGPRQVRMQDFMQEQGPGTARRPANGRIEAGAIPGHKGALDLSSLNLSDQQKQQIRKIHGQNGQVSRDLRKNLQSARLDLRDLMFAPNATDGQILAKRKEVRQMQDRMEEMQISDFLSIRHVLTPDQRQRLADLKPTGRVAESRGPADGGPADPTPPPRRPPE